MKKIAKRQTKHNQMFLLNHGLQHLIRSDSEMLSWPNNLGPNVLFGDEEANDTPLHHLVELTDPADYSTHEKQLILAKQLIEHGTNVNALSIPHGLTPLHRACYQGNVTNIDFVEYLLEEGADPNSKDHNGLTPLIYTTPNAPGAAKFLLNWPTTEANITARSGASFQARVLNDVNYLSYQAALPDNPEKVQHQFLLQQWRVIEERLLEKNANATRITAIG